jgi:O-methyltransferase.
VRCRRCNWIALHRSRQKHPHIECISFDLSPVEPVAKKHITAAGLADRIRTATGDFFQDPLPKADVITMGMILHDWNLEKKMKLIRAVYDALPPGGASSQSKR